MHNNSVNTIDVENDQAIQYTFETDVTNFQVDQNAPPTWLSISKQLMICRKVTGATAITSFFHNMGDIFLTAKKPCVKLNTFSNAHLTIQSFPNDEDLI